MPKPPKIDRVMRATGIDAGRVGLAYRARSSLVAVLCNSNPEDAVTMDQRGLHLTSRLETIT